MRASTPRSAIALACAALCTAAAPVAADTATATVAEPGGAVPETSYASRKQALIAAKAHAAASPEISGPKAADLERRWQRELDRRVGKQPATVINIYNTWTHEYLSVDLDADATLGQDAARAEPLVPERDLDRFLRCHYTNEPTHMDPRLLRVLVAAAQHFGVTRVDIVSGFRSPKYNRVLRKKGREVSRNSQHPRGNAVDFRLPGIAVKRLHAWAKSLHLGGVGLYPHSGFIHVDTARVRYWTGR